LRPLRRWQQIIIDPNGQRRREIRQVIAAAEAKAHELVRDRCQRELELSAARPTQSQTPKPQNALEMSKQHLNAFSVTPRSFEMSLSRQQP
jgi:hypothetical protein